jgi:alpha-galactosidase
VLKIFDEQSKIRTANKPNGWNDPDMLEVGNKGLSYTESKSHFTLWCMMAAPLIAGNNLAAMKADILKVLTNKAAIAVDQDPLGIQCFLWSKTDNGVEAWVKPLSDGSLAVCLLNRNANAEPVVDFNWKKTIKDPDTQKEYTMDDSYSISDIWNNKDLGTTAKKLTTTLNGHDVLFVILKKK